MSIGLEGRVKFDGQETRKDTDQYVRNCKGGAVNLHIYRLGSYPGCNKCGYQDKCKEGAISAGESAED